MGNLKRDIFVVTILSVASTLCFSHEGGTSEHHMEGKASRFLGSVELRPSLESGTGNMFGENTVEVGYQANEKFALGYQQEIHHNLVMKESNPEHEGLGLHMEEGFFNAHLHELWESSDEKASLSMEPRIHTPTSGEDREKGFVTAALSYVKFRRNLGKESSLSLMDAPVLYVYSVPGANIGDEFEANPIFQNRFRASMDFSFLERKFSVSVPLLFYLTRHREYDVAAKHNNAWTTFVGLAPELNYKATENLIVGVAVVTPNLLNSADSDHSVNHGRTSTVSQLILRAEL